MAVWLVGYPGIDPDFKVLPRKSGYFATRSHSPTPNQSVIEDLVELAVPFTPVLAVADMALNSLSCRRLTDYWQLGGVLHGLLGLRPKLGNTTLLRIMDITDHERDYSLSQPYELEVSPLTFPSMYHYLDYPVALYLETSVGFCLELAIEVLRKRTSMADLMAEELGTTLNNLLLRDDRLIRRAVTVVQESEAPTLFAPGVYIIQDRNHLSLVEACLRAPEAFRFEIENAGDHFAFPCDDNIPGLREVLREVLGGRVGDGSPEVLQAEWNKVIKDWHDRDTVWKMDDVRFHVPKP